MRVFFAPGRVNLIGEHTDYNGGSVLPCALDRGTYVAVEPRGDRTLRLFSRNFAACGTVESRFDSLDYDPAHGWANYPKGIIQALDREVELPGGLDLSFWGNLPLEAGLASSASIELATAVAANDVYSLGLDRVALARLAQRVEREYIGVNCGIMDQFTAAAGRRGHALLLHCGSLEYRHVPLPLKRVKLVVADTNRRRALAESAYNDRRATCERALERLQVHHARIASLAELDPAGFEALRGFLTPLEARRARHVVEEQQRTLLGAGLLEKGDLDGFGRLMRASHESLRELYDVTGVELDTLVEAAWRHEGTIGARMTGAGFGGCTVNLVRAEYVKDFAAFVGAEYERRVGHRARFYVMDASDGAREVTQEAMLAAGEECLE